MNSEDKSQNLIFVILICLAVALSYSALPEDPTSSAHENQPQARWILRPALARWLQSMSPPTASHTESASAEQEESSQEIEDGKEDQPVEPVEPQQEVTQSEEGGTASQEDIKDHTDTKPDSSSSPEQASTLVASADSQDIILMDTPGYEKHTKPIVRFTHQKHMDEYAESCGECHHDNEGKPLDLSPDDEVGGCIQCHQKTKTVKGEKLSKADKIKTYHKEALHANCIDCHKEYNISKGDPKGKKPAPVSCNACHKK